MRALRRDDFPDDCVPTTTSFGILNSVVPERAANDELSADER